MPLAHHFLVQVHLVKERDAAWAPLKIPDGEKGLPRYKNSILDLGLFNEEVYFRINLYSIDKCV